MKTTQFLQNALTNGGPLTRMHAAMEFMAHADEYLPWLAAREFRGITVTRKETEWVATLKAYRGQHPEVAFFAAESLEELYYAVAWGVLYGLNRWKPDKWGTMRSDKK